MLIIIIFNIFCIKYYALDSFILFLNQNQKLRFRLSFINILINQNYDLNLPKLIKIKDLDLDLVYKFNN